MTLRLVSTVVLLLGLSATALLLWPEAPAERVATRIEMIATPRAPVAALASCPTVPQVARATDI